MFNSLTRLTLLGIYFPLTFLTTFNAYADDDADSMAFSYTFEGNRFFLCDGGVNDGLSCTTNDDCPLGQCDDQPPWEPGATLTGEIDGTVDPLNPDRVIIISFGQVVLSRPTLEVFEYDEIDASEFGTDSDGGTPVMSFLGNILDFESCPKGFTEDTDGDGVRDDCAFGISAGGGFLVNSERSLATAADGTGAETCPDQRRLHGCRVTDNPILAENWGLVVLPDSADVDPSAVIGSGSTIKKNIVIEEGAVLGKNVTLNKGAVIGANSMIGDDTIIDKGVYVCSGIAIGSVVKIGKNRLVDTNVPDGIVWNGTNDLPDPADCP